MSTRTTNRNVRAALRFARQHPELAYDNRCDGCGALLDEQDYRLCGGCNDALDDGGHAGIGFYSTTPDGHAIHVNGARDMPPETLAALAQLADLAFAQYAPKHDGRAVRHG